MADEKEIEFDKNVPCYAVELHNHLDGCVTPEIVYSAAKRNKIKLPHNVKCAKDLTPHIVCVEKQDSLRQLLGKFTFFLPFIANDKISLTQLCESFAKQQYTNRIYYSEVRYCPHLLAGDKLSAEEVVVLISDSLRTASNKYGIIIKSLLCCMRSWKADKRALEIIALAVKYGQSNGGDVVGIDLAGDEALTQSNPDHDWNKIMKIAKEKHNLKITIHAGEACGPKSVYDALDELYADRIGHGYACTKDKDLMERVKNQNVHLECCPTSSVFTNAVSLNGDWSKHPIIEFQKNGINWGLNTDDPAVLNCSYQGDVDILINECKLSKEDVAAAFIRAARASFLNDEERKDLVKEVKERIQLHYLQKGKL